MPVFYQQGSQLVYVMVDERQESSCSKQNNKALEAFK